MAKLTTNRRKALPASEFAIKSSRKYPVDTKARAANAKARAQQQFDKGNISKGTLSKIDSAANKVLKKTAKKTAVKKTTPKKTTTKPKSLKK